MTVDIGLAHRFMELFNGANTAYGVFQITKKRASDGKAEGKAVTKTGEVDTDLWLQHLRGEQGIGIIPIKDDSTCFFGAIDIDSYHINHGQIVKKVEDLGLPVVPCRSKSGGVHLFMFINEPAPADLVQQKLHDIAASVGFGGSEIFPKQTELLSDRGDQGSWINMPYFNGKRGLRYALTEGGDGISAREFVKAAEEVRLNLTQLEQFSVVRKDDLADGPPCLQHLISQGFPEGTRNDGLFNLGVYLRNSRGDDWQKLIEEYNHRYMFPPLGSTEVQTIVKSVGKKNYYYTCDRVPLQPHCNSKMCRNRKYGVGSGDSMPVLSALTKYDSRPAIWFLEIEGIGRIELTTEELQSPFAFQRKCMEMLNVCPPVRSKPQWEKTIQVLMEDVNVIEASDDATPVGQFMELLEKFCLGRTSDNLNDLLIGRVYTDDDYHFFRLTDLMKFLDRNGFRELKRNKITHVMRENHGRPKFFNVQGRGVNTWRYPAFEEPEDELDPPDMEDNVI